MAADERAIREWIENSPYSSFLGVRLEDLREDGVTLALPYSDDNSNPGQALHGGCAASLSAMGGVAVAHGVLGEQAGPFHTAGLQVNYLAAAIGEDVVAEARLLRRGKTLCFAEVDVATRDGKSIAHTTTLVRARFGAEEPRLPLSAGDHGESDPGPMGPHIGQVPFIGNRGIRVEHMTGGTSRLVMPFDAKNNADLAGGNHEGAVLALLDTAGAMGSWAESGPGRYKASTPSMQAQVLGRPDDEDLVAYGTCRLRDGDLFWTDVEVCGASTRRVTARGTVIYRIVT